MTVVKMGLVPAICQSDDPVTADELAKASGGEKLLIGTTKLPRFSDTADAKYLMQCV